jgi:hypothetical protein
MFSVGFSDSGGPGGGGGTYVPKIPS